MHGIRPGLLCLLLPTTVALSKDIDMSPCQYEFDLTNAALGMRDEGGPGGHAASARRDPERPAHDLAARH
ncbi:hypothetical protein [Pseudoxanthomonas sp.]|uniref:hypothetical protein n=1 Tax=Pseudoxanthomonas sp. TaxID=1871049 RepID=UPI0028C41DC2|nr:hypothetical protein [Pseudoxanthomonas sp.]